MDSIILKLEAHLVRGPGQCHKLLGVAPSTYAAYKAGDTEVPLPVRLHIDLLLRIPGDLLLEIERERLK